MPTSTQTAQAWIIEHPTRGTLKSFAGPDEIRFSTIGARNDPDKTLQFTSADDAKRVFALLPAKVRARCVILTRPPDRARYEEEHAHQWGGWYSWRAGGAAFRERRDCECGAYQARKRRDD